MQDVLATERLRLISMTAARLAADESGAGLAEACGCAVSEEWPPPHWEPHVFAVMREQYRMRPEVAGWNRYIAIRDETGEYVVAGTLGAFARQAEGGECEVGYSLVLPAEGRGYATEALQKMLSLLRDETDLQAVIAHTFPELRRSIRVLEKCGFLEDGRGEEEGTVRYRLELR